MQTPPLLMSLGWSERMKLFSSIARRLSGIEESSYANRVNSCQTKLQCAKLATKLYELIWKDCHEYIVKMKHIFYAAVHITLRSRALGLLLYGRAASVTLEKYHSLLSGISKMSRKSLIYHHHQRNMSIFKLKISRNIINILVSHIWILNLRILPSMNSRLWLMKTSLILLLYPKHGYEITIIY